MLIVDAHQDIAFNAMALGRDYAHSVAATRQREGSVPEDIATLGLPDALASDVGLVFGTLFVAPEDSSHLSPLVYRTPKEAHGQARQQLEHYRALAERPDVVLIETRRDLAALLAARAQGQALQGIVVLMEGADPVLVPEQVTEWQSWGVRIVGPAWSQTRYSGGTNAPGPLTLAGRELIREMAGASIALDTSHMAEASFWEALELFDGPLLASHSNCRALVSQFRPDRHLSDAMIKALVERDGVIGAVLYNKFLLDGWTLADGKNAVGLDVVVRHIDHICQIAGDARHVGIGSDLDGGFGCEAIPRELDTVADLPRIGDALKAHGYSEADIQAILGGNWLRKLGEVLPE